jgi:hypothetical protein
MATAISDTRERWWFAGGKGLGWLLQIEETIGGWLVRAGGNGVIRRRVVGEHPTREEVEAWASRLNVPVG